MIRGDKTYNSYVQILKEELVPAMGCTEPIAIAYAAAKAREVLGGMPDQVRIGVSDNIINHNAFFAQNITLPDFWHSVGYDKDICTADPIFAAPKENNYTIFINNIHIMMNN